MTPSRRRLLQAAACTALCLSAFGSLGCAHQRLAANLPPNAFPPNAHFEFPFAGPGQLTCTAALIRKPGGNWREETLSSPPCSMGVGFNYREVQRSPQNIILLDASRSLYARVPLATDGPMELSSTAQGPWRVIHQLHYVSGGFV